MAGFGRVLGSGAARGLAHIGVWRVLEDAGRRPQALAGTSMGRLVAAFIAAGTGAEELRRISETGSYRRLLGWRPGTGLLRASAFGAWLGAHLPPPSRRCGCRWPSRRPTC